MTTNINLDLNGPLKPYTKKTGFAGCLITLKADGVPNFSLMTVKIDRSDSSWFIENQKPRNDFDTRTYLYNIGAAYHAGHFGGISISNIYYNETGQIVVLSDGKTAELAAYFGVNPSDETFDTLMATGVSRLVQSVQA